MKWLIAALFALITLESGAQGKDVPIDIHYYADSLHSGSTKDPSGRVFRSMKQTMKKNGRFFLYMVSTDFDVALMVQTPSGKWLQKSGKKSDKEYYGRNGFSAAWIDTTVSEDGDYTLYYTGVQPVSKGKFLVELAYAPEESLKFNPDLKDLCEQIGVLIKHSQVGFRFMRTGSIQTEHGETYFPSYYQVTSPLSWFGDPKQRIETCEYCDAYRYTTVVFDGPYDAVKAKYESMKSDIRTCFGEFLTYLEKTGSTGYLTFGGIAKGETPVIRSWAAQRKDGQYDINITLYGAPGSLHARLVMDLQNHFEPIEQ